MKSWTRLLMTGNAWPKKKAPSGIRLTRTWRSSNPLLTFITSWRQWSPVSRGIRISMVRWQRLRVPLWCHWNCLLLLCVKLHISSISIRHLPFAECPQHLPNTFRTFSLSCILQATLCDTHYDLCFTRRGPKLHSGQWLTGSSHPAGAMPNLDLTQDCWTPEVSFILPATLPLWLLDKLGNTPPLKDWAAKGGRNVWRWDFKEREREALTLFLSSSFLSIGPFLTKQTNKQAFFFSYKIFKVQCWFYTNSTSQFG